jgi:hypothetical protein
MFPDENWALSGLTGWVDTIGRHGRAKIFEYPVKIRYKNNLFTTAVIP